jgi:Skp family chaperone for outer membrane proteins
MYTSQLEKISKKFGFIAFALFIFIAQNNSAFAVNISSVTNAENKFAVINIQKVTESCSVFRDIRGQMEERSKSLSAKFDEKIKKIQDDENSLKKKKDILGKEALEAEIKKIDTNKKMIQSESQDESKKLQKVYFDTITTMNKKMTGIIENYAKEKKINAIFEVSGIIYNNLDNVTDDIIEIMNKELPNFKVTFE